MIAKFKNLIIPILFLICIGCTSPESYPPRSVADVSFTGTQFIIYNKSSSDWKDVIFKVNPQTFKSGYVFKTSLIKSGETYTIGAMNFTKSDGEKFNPFTHKPLNFEIWAEGNLISSHTWENKDY